MCAGSRCDREGGRSRQMGQGESLATAAHALAGRQGCYRAASNREPGRKTSGVDGITWETPEKKVAAVDAVRGRGYRPLPLRRIYIPKSNGKLRPLAIPTMKDRAMQALYLLALDPVAETAGDVNSSGSANSARADAIQDCFAAFKASQSALGAGRRYPRLFRKR